MNSQHASPLASASVVPSQPADPGLRRVALVLSALASTLAAFVLLGWALDIDAFKSVIRGPVTMKPNAAVAIILLSVAIVLLPSVPHPSALRRSVATVLATAVALFTFLSLVQDLGGADFGLDQWLFRDPDRSGRSVPGRMSPATAYSMILLGAAVLTFVQSQSQRWRPPIVLGLSASVAVVATLAIGGRLVNNYLGSSFWNFTPISFDTAICLLLLGLAVFCAAKAEGLPPWSVDAFLSSGFVVGIASLMLTAGSTYYLARQLQHQVDALVNAEEVIKVVEEVARDLSDTTSMLRAYVITGNEIHLQRRDQALADFNSGVAKLRALLRGQPEAVGQLATLDQSMSERTQAGDRIVEVRRSQGLEAAAKVSASARGAMLTDKINAVLADLRFAQYAHLDRGKRLSAESARRTFLMMPLGAIISISLMMLGLFVLNRALAERQQSLKILHESETQFRAIFDGSNDGIVVTDDKDRIVQANASASLIFGYGRRPLTGIEVTELMPSLYEGALASDGELPQAPADQRLARSARELDALLPDQRRLKVEVSSSEFETSAGRFLALVVRDVSARHEADRKLRRLTNFYDALSRTNQAVVHLRDEPSLFNEICRICVEHGHAIIAYVALIDGDLITPRASAGPAQSFLEKLRIVRDPANVLGQGPVAVAVRTGKPYICNDFFSDPRTMPWRELTASIKTQSTVAFPIRRGGTPIGALSLHMRERHFFDEQLVALLTEMSEDLSFALDNIAREQERKAVGAALDASEVRMRRLFDQANDGILILSADGRFVECNRAAADMLGYSTQEMSALNLRQVLVPAEHDRLLPSASGLQEGVPSLQEWECLRKDGTLFVGEVSTRALDASSYLAIVRDLSERKRAERHMEHLATHDELTGLPNHRLIRDRIARAVSQAKRAGRQIAVMYVDVDRFKVINDAYGRAAGDALLVAASKRLGQLVRDEDTVARQSGDAFVLLLAELRKFSDAYIVVQKLVDGFSMPFELHGSEVPLGISIGVSVYPQDGDDPDVLISHAEVAMYRAKELGRGTYQFFTQEMSRQTREQVMLETGLRAALAQHELHLVYQPKVDLQTGTIVGSEALLRWNRSEFGAVSPAKFIPVAEESGLIVPIGEWALHTACLQARAWEAAGLDAGLVSVNLSVRQFLRVNVVDWVLGTLEQTGLDPRRLELELTESLIAHDTDQVIDTINRLRAAGVTISIDDFGTGYSSLSYLKRFKVNTLKIDQSFIRNMLKDPEDAAIPIAVISLAHALGLKVIAEGVETAEHCTVLREHGCDQIQGYFFSPPVSADDFGAMLARGRRSAADEPPRIIDAA